MYVCVYFYSIAPDGLLKMEGAALRANMSVAAFKEQLEKYMAQ